ncbi:MAG TPA: RluA family pseudouridine synthase [Candidatus Saccharimonadales bacterium]
MSNLELSRAQRLDQKVVELVPGVSRAFAAKLIEQGKVRVNGEVTPKPGYKLHEADRVAVEYDVSELAAIPHIDVPVLYEDADCVVISKPVGVLSHSKGAFNPEATVATWLREHLLKHKNTLWEVCPPKGGGIDERAGIVHRLDRATSGVMICAKTPAALKHLQRQFAQRRVKKTYVAVVSGQLPHEHAIIDMPIERNPKRPQTFRVGANGKPAKTQYHVVRVSGELTELELAPQTGRTHQLRVHLSNLGHPIVGDELYGGRPAERLYLHARELEITLPNRERRTFTAATPPAFTDIMK